MVRNVIVCCFAFSAAAEPGTVQGSVRFAGPTPKRVAIKPTKDPGVCGQRPLLDESLVVDQNGGLANVVISIEGVKAEASAAKPILVDQSGCRYTPHVQAAMVGSELQFSNSDATLHNVHAFSEDDTLFNVALPSVGSRARQKIQDAGVIELKCDAGHSWMQAYVVAFEHPFFAVTGESGGFQIAGLPPGHYRLTAWHEKLGRLESPIEVKADSTSRAEMTYK